MTEDFSVQVTKWVEKAKGSATTVFRGIGMQAVTRVKELTPVKTGYLRANFVDLLNDQAVPSPAPTQITGAAISAAHIGDKIVIANPVVYARRVEFGFVGTDSLGRHYSQPGRHFVAQTVAELPSIAEKVVQQAKRGSR